MEVQAGVFYTAVVDASGVLATWGEGAGGKLGHGDESDHVVPRAVELEDLRCEYISYESG